MNEQSMRSISTKDLGWQLEQLEAYLKKVERDKGRTVEHINRIRAELRRRVTEGEG